MPDTETLVVEIPIPVEKLKETLDGAAAGTDAAGIVNLLTATMMSVITVEGVREAVRSAASEIAQLHATGANIVKHHRTGHV